MWFKNLFGFEEISPENVRKNISVEGEFLNSKVNFKKYRFGTLEIPALEELRQRIPLDGFDGKIRIEEVVGNAGKLHRDPENKNAVFQAASQFNLLEMVSPHKIPEDGVGIYENDKTQGPACAISCGAGTVYRNYFADVNGKTGQTSENQINCLEKLSAEFENEKLNIWKMQNGYAMFSQDGLAFLNEKLSILSHEEQENLAGKLKIGIQWNTEVTTADSDQIVTQVYCSALPIGYHSSGEKKHFEEFARLILDAAYEATFYTAVQNLMESGSPKLFLTMVGGGVFGNELEWILAAIEKSLQKFSKVPLDVKIVSYGRSETGVMKLKEKFSTNQ